MFQTYNPNTERIEKNIGTTTITKLPLEKLLEKKIEKTIFKKRIKKAIRNSRIGCCFTKKKE